MVVKFFSKQSRGTKPAQFYKVNFFELVAIVIVINVVIGGFSGEYRKLLTGVTVR